VLRITELSRKGRTLRLEGEVLGPWVGALRDACAPSGRRLRLDLAGVTYIDAAGVQLLRELAREGVELTACSNFIAELLHLEPEE
jgi:ABC-type transporter Mla MlaB component